MMTATDHSQKDWDNLITERDLLQEQVRELRDELEVLETERRLVAADLDAANRKLEAEAQRYKTREAVLAVGHLL